MPPSRLSIDTLRGLACLLLVAFHVVGATPFTGLKLPAHHPAAELNDWLSLLRMPLFSFLSGMVYAYRPVRGDIEPFARRKARRLLVPMLIVGTTFALLQSMAPGVNAERMDWRLLHIQPVAHYWFLEALFGIFLLVALLDRLRLLDSLPNLAAIGVLAGVLQVEAPVPVWFGFEGATYLLPYFLLGIAANRFHDVLAHRAVACAAGVLLAVALADLASTPSLSLAAQQTAPELAASVCCCLLVLNLRPQLQWLAWIGKWSFGIYLFHAIFAAATRIAMTRLGVESLPLLFAAGMVSGIAAPIALTAVLRRVPGGHWVLGEKGKVEAGVVVGKPA